MLSGRGIFRKDCLFLCGRARSLPFSRWIIFFRLHKSGRNEHHIQSVVIFLDLAKAGKVDRQNCVMSLKVWAEHPATWGKLGQMFGFPTPHSQAPLPKPPPSSISKVQIVEDPRYEGMGVRTC